MAEPARLVIRGFELGAWGTNCYVAHTEAGGECWIVDTGFEPQPLLDYVQQQGLAPSHVLLTHAHLDHIGGLAEVRRRWSDVPILVHPAETDFLTDPDLNLASQMGMDLVAPPATGTLGHGQMLDMGGHRFEIRHTPGHSPGGVTLYCAQQAVALVGDVLFAGSIGRSDFPTSNHGDLMKSIRAQLMTMPDATRVLPGHGPGTTVGRERTGNPYL